MRLDEIARRFWPAMVVTVMVVMVVVMITEFNTSDSLYNIRDAAGRFLGGKPWLA